jgi:hypothetical protein
MTECRTTVRGHSGGPANWAGAAALILCACSAGTRTPAPPAHPEVVEMEVVPSAMAMSSDVTQPTRFVLEVRLWSRVWNKPSAIPESAGLIVHWSVTPANLGLHLVGDPHGYRATLELDPKVTLASTVVVRAQAGTLTAESRIEPAATGQDQVEASYTEDMAPDAVIVRGVQGTQPCSIWLAPALTRTGQAGDVDAECVGGDAWAVALLDQAHGAELYDGKWAGVQVVKATPAPAVRSVPVALRVFIGGSASDLATRQADARSFTLAEMDDADTVFKDSRVGIDLNVVDDQIVTAPTDGSETAVTNCLDGNRRTGGSDYTPIGKQSILHVYVVDDLDIAEGFTCPATSVRPFPVIYLQQARQSGTILVHELGHALGLDLPGAGHSDDMSHFDAANVMVSGYAWDNVWRRRFTVGQVLRMNAEGGSWLNWGLDLASKQLRDAGQARLACQCGFDDPAGRCPRLADDIAKPRGSTSRMSAWDCGDVVRVEKASSGDEPMALIAGRLWRSPPDLSECRRDLVGKALSIPTTTGTATYVQSENVTGPGRCPSWVAIFLRDHQPVGSDLTNVKGAWTDAADVHLLDPPLVDRQPVTIYVYHDVTDAAQAATGKLDADQVYGPANRTGIDLTLKLEQSSCPTTPPTDQRWVCYSSASGSTVAQLVGKELGIPDLTTAQQNDPAFIDNAFLTTAGRGTKLTLGQVFRIHAKLGTSGFPCGDPTSWCHDPSSWPPLEAGVQP